MKDRASSMDPARTATRRQIFSGIGIAFASAAAAPSALGKTAQQTMEEKPSNAANQTRTSLHMEIAIKAAPQRIYDALLDPKQFAAFTGQKAEIDPRAGGAFSMFGAMIEGRNIELLPARRIVQAWRPTHWDAGIYSIVRFQLEPQSSGTTVVLDHTGFPKGEFDHLDWGWHAHYWEPLKKFLAE